MAIYRFCVFIVKEAIGNTAANSIFL